MITQEPLFGIGLGNFVWMHILTSESGASTAPHNSYLWAAAEGGVPALLLYFLFFWYAFKSLRQVERETREPDLHAMASGLRIGLLVFLSFSFFAEFWLNIITYILVGMTIVIKRLQEQERLFTLPGVATRVESRGVPA
jgi:O-antigen ligase